MLLTPEPATSNCLLDFFSLSTNDLEEKAMFALIAASMYVGRGTTTGPVTTRTRLLQPGAATQANAYLGLDQLHAQATTFGRASGVWFRICFERRRLPDNYKKTRFISYNKSEPELNEQLLCMPKGACY